MTWMQPPTTNVTGDLTGTETRKPNKYHLVGERMDGDTWVSACDMKARQYAHFKRGHISENPCDKCGRCSQIERQKESL